MTGSYPADPEPPRPAVVRRAREDFAAGLITAKELERALQRATVEAVGEMLLAGVEVVSDGRIRWEDPVSLVFRNLDGFKPIGDGVWRALEPVRWARPLTVDDYRLVAERSPVEVRAVIPGPFSLARLCDPGFYGNDVEALTMDLADALHRELEGLEAAGARHILVEEALLASCKTEVDEFSAAMQHLLHGLKAQVMISAPGGDLVGIEDEIAALPVAGVVLDLVQGPDNDLLVEHRVFGEARVLQLGIIAGDVPVVERDTDLAETMLKFARWHNPGLLWVGPNTGMGALPRDIAFEKLSSLYRAVIAARRELARREVDG